MNNPKILLVNDDETAARYIRERLILNYGYVVLFELSLNAALDSFKRDSFDVVIVKYNMQDADSNEFLKSLKEHDADCIIIAIVEKIDSLGMKELSQLGVYDFIAQPVNFEKLFFLIQRGLELKTLMFDNRKLSQGLKEQNQSLQKQNTLLARRIEESTKNLSRLYEDLRNTYMRTIKSLAQAIDARDHYTHSHSENVANIAEVIAKEMGLSVKEIELVRDACALHDLGKIGIEDKILSKPSKLDPEEWEYIKKHPEIGAKILEPLTFLNDVIDLVRQHHEHYDGSGYPDGRKGEEILLGARIILLADAYEAMTSARAYRKVPLTKEAAVEEIKKYSGTQFDPLVVEVFLRVIDKL